MNEVSLLSRAKQIERLRSRDITPFEHMFNRLKGPMVHQILSRDDTLKLYEIATSVKYSSKPKKKFEAINEIMNSRGFVKLGQGTNRIAYRFVEDNSFICKVAFDDVGCKDNPREYFNQNIFKPYVTKIFDYSPEGAVGTAERVEPIRNRAQFLAVADDVFPLMDSILINGEYILADFGSKYWANYGVRQGFGPVLLDFPYVFKLDGNKLYCHAPAPTPTGICGGEIDFDIGYNKLYCKKCGVEYNASELAECTKINLETPFIGVGIGETKFMNMKVRINGVDKVIGDENNTGFKAPVGKIGDVDFSKFIKRSGESTPTETVEEPKQEEVIEETVVKETSKLNDNTLDDIAKEAVENIEKEEAKTAPIKKEKKSPFSEGAPKSYKEQFDEAFKNLLSTYQMVKGMDPENLEQYKSAMVGLAKDIISENNEDMTVLEDIYNTVTSYYTPETDGEYYYYEEGESSEDNGIEEPIEEAPQTEEEVVIDEEEPADDQVDMYSGIAWYQASNINIKSIFTNETDCPVLVLNNEDGTYLRDADNRLIAIDDIDGQNLAALQFASKKVIQKIERDTEVATGNNDTNIANNTGAFPPSQK